MLWIKSSQRRLLAGCWFPVLPRRNPHDLNDIAIGGALLVLGPLGARPPQIPNNNAADDKDGKDAKRVGIGNGKMRTLGPRENG